MSNLSHALRFVSLLQKKGCEFALDDFGSPAIIFHLFGKLRVEYI